MTDEAPAPPTRGQRRLWAPVLGIALLPILMAASYGLCIQDDAYISYRYARNFADGLGLVYNPGERVEGFTNFLWTLGLGVAGKLGLGPVGPSVAVGLASAIGLVLATGAAARRWLPAPASLAGVTVAALAIGADPYFGLEAVQGLETSFFALLVGLTAFLWMHERETERPTPVPASAAVAALAFWTRPEGALVFAILEGFALLDGPREVLRRRWRGWLLFGGAVVTLEAIRLIYYGDPLPNTFYAKVGYTLEQWQRGARYLLDFSRDHLVLTGLNALGLCTMAFDRRARRLAPLAGLCTLYLFYVSLVGGDFKPTHRFVAPMLGPLALMGALGVATVATRSRIVAWLLVALLAFEMGTARDDVTWFAEKRVARREAWELTARFLSEHYSPETRIAIHSAGTLPYLTDFTTLDLWGLTMPRSAPRDEVRMGSGIAGHERTTYGHVFGTLRPELYVAFAKPVTDEPRPGILRKRIPADLLEGYIGESARWQGRWVNYVRRIDVEPTRPVPEGMQAPIVFESRQSPEESEN